MANLLFSSVVLFLFIFSASTSAKDSCNGCVHQANITFFSTDSALLSSGSCGYGSLALGFNAGNLAAAVPSLYKEGVGCGACFQIKCKNSKVCNKKGKTVMIVSSSELNKNKNTDFVLNKRAFAGMANSKANAQSILKLGTVDVDYRRVACDLEKKNLAVRVEESSKKPSYLAVQFLYQGGKTEILAADVSQVDSGNWISMSRKKGVIWVTDRAPVGALIFRVVVMGGYDAKWFYADKQAVPGNWKVGKIYDTGVQISDVAQDGCSPC